MLKKVGLDWHSGAGAMGFVAAIIVGHWSELAGALAALATAAYMGLRAAREWVKLKRDLAEKTNSVPIVIPIVKK